MPKSNDSNSLLNARYRILEVYCINFSIISSWEDFLYSLSTLIKSFMYSVNCMTVGDSKSKLMDGPISSRNSFYSLTW